MTFNRTLGALVLGLAAAASLVGCGKRISPNYERSHDIYLNNVGKVSLVDFDNNSQVDGIRTAYMAKQGAKEYWLYLRPEFMEKYGQDQAVKPKEMKSNMHLTSTNLFIAMQGLTYQIQNDK